MKKLFSIIAIAALLSTGTVHAQEKKVVVKETVHLKKDGTPDKRYKENKTVVHLKKDGTPDKRYSENKTVVKDNKTVVKKTVVVKKK